MNKPSVISTCDCLSEMSRRQFLKSGAVLAGVAALSAAPGARSFAGSDLSKGRSETLVTSLYKSLTEEQRKKVCFPFDHPLRSKVDNNWQITDKSITELFNKDEQELIRQIFLNLHSPEYAETVMQQVIHDSGKEGFGVVRSRCSVNLGRADSSLS